MQDAILNVSHLSAAAIFLLLAALVLFSRTRTLFRWALFAAAAVTALWAGLIAAEGTASIRTAWAELAELARTLSWILVVALLLGIGRGAEARTLRTVLGPGLSVPAAVILWVWFAPRAVPGLFLGGRDLVVVSGAASMTLAVAGLLLLENLYRNAGRDARWALKFLCFGLGAIFAYDFFYYADSVLFRRFDQVLYEARGFTNALAAPLVAIGVSRSHTWSVDIHVSRGLVFHSAILVGSGLYLLVMAGAGFYVREFGGEWGSVLQVTFFAGAILLLVAVFSSDALRAQARIFIAKNFFSAKYDYREEWLRFIGALSGSEGKGALPERIARSVSEILDCRAAALWVRSEEDAAYRPVFQWNFPRDLPDFPADIPFLRRLEADQAIVNLNHLRRNPPADGEAAPPRWLIENGRAWLVLPLSHQEALTGLLVLGQSRAERNLNWEDHDLLLTVGRQAASYLAEDQAAQALIEARQMEAFNRRFAFVAHDLKNVVGQLAALTANAERHGDNPEFRKDMLMTLGNAVGKMRALLEQLSARKEPAEAPALIALDDSLARAARAWCGRQPALAVELAPTGAQVAGMESRLLASLDHLIQNAWDAAGEEGHVVLRSRREGTRAIVEVEDDGPGMDDAFVRDKLFRPFETTKPTGYGMGVYQVRQYLREMAGDLRVETALGRGTVMRLVLPVAEEAEAAPKPAGTVASQ